MDFSDLLKTLVLGSPEQAPAPSRNQPAAPSGMGNLAKLAIPLILMALYRNANNKKRGEALSEALKDHEQTPAESIGRDIFGKLEKADTTDGGKILGHVLGKDSDVIAAQIAAKAGVTIDQAKEMMSSLAPLIMETLADQTKGNRNPEVVRDTVRDQLQKMDTAEGTPGLPDIFRDMLSGQTSQAKKTENEGGIGGMLKDLMGGASDEADEPGLLDSLGGLGGIGDILGKLIK